MKTITYLGATLTIQPAKLEGVLWKGITHFMSLNGPDVLGFTARPISDLPAALWHVRKRIRRDKALFAARRAK